MTQGKAAGGGRPLAIDLFCGLGGWTEGLLAEGYRVVGYDIEAHEYGDERYPAELVLADVLDLHGSLFADADLIVASPPCQFFSYTAMPWSRAKTLAAEVRDDPAKLAERLALFNACFRIQREASEAAGRHIPMIVENVRGAIPWVGRSRGNYGSYYFWGDVPALLPAPVRDAYKVPGFRFDGVTKRCFQETALRKMREPGTRRTDVGKGARFTSRDCGVEKTGKPINRKAASAKIAKIPLTLSRFIAAHYRPSAGALLAHDSSAHDELDAAFGAKNVPSASVCTTDPLTLDMIAVSHEVAQHEAPASHGGTATTLHEIRQKDEPRLRRVHRTLGHWLDMLDQARGVVTLPVVRSGSR